MTNDMNLPESNKGETFPGKDTVYRFLNHSDFAWRKLLISLSVYCSCKSNCVENTEGYWFIRGMIERIKNWLKLQ